MGNDGSMMGFCRTLPAVPAGYAAGRRKRRKAQTKCTCIFCLEGMVHPLLNNIITCSEKNVQKQGHWVHV